MSKSDQPKDLGQQLSPDFQPLIELYNPTEGVGFFFKGMALRMVEYGSLSKEWLHSFGELHSLQDCEIDLLFKQLVAKGYAEKHEKGFVLLQQSKEFFEDYDRRICSCCHALFAPKMLKLDITELHDPFYSAQHSLGVCSKQCHLFVKQRMPKKQKRKTLKQQKMDWWVVKVEP